MIPHGNGRHCDSCSKTVIDFSQMTDKEIQDYFIVNQNTGICGRFKNEQIERIRIVLPGYILTHPIATWKKYLAILLICFGSFLFPIDVTVAQIPVSHELSGHLQTRAQDFILLKSISWSPGLVSIEDPILSKLDIDIRWVTMGYTITKPEEAPPVIRDINKTFPATSEDSITTPQLDMVITPLKKEKPSKKSTEDRMEFYLPTPMALRRRRNKLS